MTSWREPDYCLLIDCQESLKKRLDGYAIEVKLHRQGIKYPLQAMIMSNLSCLWLLSSKAKVAINTPLEIEIKGCCDPMHTFDKIDPLNELIGTKLQGKITSAFKQNVKELTEQQRVLRKPTP